ncbi:hypothetical protein HN018_08325 [Lichenicola cladoniae]|uniref:Uncharacterized protein n=1 Tax=Lichenicola cladoniae TaxID=1484109 RepID=A0A6M8HP42_9PROT|nr:hypothetical protein [Lichenicola cladoniae]NPD68465.1 hypothetical protein [Acetobacteraceae bacterium]QKE90055.1 hypothetical protein HN018_08325 [Lichenicola cladoniae]
MNAAYTVLYLMLQRGISGQHALRRLAASDGWSVGRQERTGLGRIALLCADELPDGFAAHGRLDRKPWKRLNTSKARSLR